MISKFSFIILEVAYDLSAICNAISGGFQYCEEDIDVETIFRSTFGGTKFCHWSFIDEESSQWRSSSNHSNYGRSRNWRQQNKEEYETESESESERSESDERLALGLSASGPLTLEDVKNA